MSYSLPVDVHSPEQLGLLIAELRDVAAQRRNQAVQAKVTGKAGADSTHISALLGQVLKEAKVAVNNPGALDEVLANLEQLRAKAPSVRLTLTAAPTRLYKQQFTTWFRANIHPDTLVTFSVRSDIGGGATLIAGSHVYDFSFREQLLRNKGRIAEIFGRVRQ